MTGPFSGLLSEISGLKRRVEYLERELLIANRCKRAILPIEHIAEMVAEKTGIPLESIRSETRRREETDARQIVMYLANVHEFSSTGKIARYLRRDHTTVMHGVKVIKSKLDHNLPLRELIEELVARLAADSSSSLLSEREEEEKVGGVLR